MLTVHGVAFLSFCCCPLFICATAIFAYIVSVTISFVVTAVCVCVRVDGLLLVFTSPAKYFVCTIVLFDVFWRHFLAEPQNSRHCSSPKYVTFWTQIKSNGANNKNRGCRASKETHKSTYTHMHEMNFVWIWMQIALWMHNLQQPSRNEGGTHLSLYGLCFYLPFVWHFAKNAHQQFHRGSVLWCSLFAVGWVTLLNRPGNSLSSTVCDSSFCFTFLSSNLANVVHTIFFAPRTHAHNFSRYAVH